MPIVAEITYTPYGHEPETIEAFLEKFPQSSEDVELLLDYPGPRPEGSFITDGEHLVAMPDDYNEFHAETNLLLQKARVPLLEDRIPVLAYGANASPARLRNKMAGFGPDVQNMMQIVPHIKATLPGALAVWHGRPGQVGSCFAELYPAEGEGVSLEAHVAYLTPEQLTVLHISEGVTYSAAELKATLGSGDNAPEMPVVAYVALEASVLLENGKPVLVKGLKNIGTDLPEKSAREAVDYMLRESAGVIGEVTIEDFVAEGRTLKLAAKKARQERIRVALAAKGMSGEYAFPVEEGSLIGRADLSSLPGRLHADVIEMPETALAAIRPSRAELEKRTEEELQNADSKSTTPQEAVRKLQDKIDPARRLAKRAHDELAVRLNHSQQQVAIRAKTH